ERRARREQQQTRDRRRGQFRCSRHVLSILMPSYPGRSMAKKKKRHRRPVAPPVHSGTHPLTTQDGAPPARPEGAIPPAPARRKPQQRKKTSRALGKKRRRWVPWVLTIVGGAAVVAAIAASKSAANKSSDPLQALAASALCGKSQVNKGSRSQHVD